MFQQSFAPKMDSEPMAKIKSTDPSHLPPCYNVLLQKISGANYVAFIWKRVLNGFTDLPSSIEHGWLVESGSYKIKWYEGRQVPENVCNFINQDFEEEDEEENTQYNSSSDESETDF